MKLEIHVHVHNPSNEAILTRLDTILERTQEIMSTQAEAAAALQAVATQLDKVKGETTALVAEVQALKDAATNADTVSPDLQAAIDAVASRTASIDGLVTDLPPTDGGVVVP